MERKRKAFISDTKEEVMVEARTLSIKIQL